MRALSKTAAVEVKMIDKNPIDISRSGFPLKKNGTVSA
jgi:hypothetical protein